MKLALRPPDLQTLRTLLRASGVQGAVAFGSRVRGDAAPGTDLDLAVTGLPDRRALASLRATLEASALPFACDVLDFDTLEAGTLREQIQRTGTVIFETSPSALSLTPAT